MFYSFRSLAKFYAAAFLLGVSIYSCTAHKNMTLASQNHKQPMESRSLIIYYDAKTGNTPLLEAIKEDGAEILYTYQNINAVAVKINHNQTAEEAIRYYEKVQGVIQVTQDQKMSVYKTAQPN